MQRIISPDTKRANRLPPGQVLTEKFPVMHHGPVQKIDPGKWAFKIHGLVKKERILDFKEFSALPRLEVFADIHCVTTWSRYNNLWEGVSSAVIKDLVEIKPEAKYVMVEGYGGFTTNLSVADFFLEDVVFALKYNGDPITAEHGGPVRFVVPQLYFWKSAKWPNSLRFMAEDAPGFWEGNGYHMHGDPWTEERYGGR